MFNEDKANQFKQKAISMGFDESLIDSFIEQKRNEPQEEEFSYIPNQETGIGIEDNQKMMSRYATPQEAMDLMPTETQGSGSILPGKYALTQAFGNRSRIEKYSGFVNLGADFAVPSNTPLAAPPGDWVVSKVSKGWSGGSGNYVQVMNTKTGEKIGYEHLNKISVVPGQRVGGKVVGLSGSTGNSTGPHASLPYQDNSGRYKDILSSQYANYLFGSS